MATAKKLASGSWNCKVYSHTEDILQADGSTKKKRIYKSFTCDIPGPKGKRKCEQLAAEWAATKEISIVTPNITVGEAIDKYIQQRSAVLSPSTVKEYKASRKRDLQELMDVKLDVLTQEQIQKAINRKCLTHSPKTVRNMHGLLTAAISAYRPDFAIKTDLPKKKRPSLYIPSDADVKRIMEFAKGTPMEIPILLAAFGPMRRSEICALDSDHINGNIVHVEYAMVQNEDKEWVIKVPKTFAGDRFIDFPDFVAEKLRGKKGQIVELNPMAVTHRFARMLKKLNIQHFRFHDLRHYSASIQHALGIPDAYIMQRGGWEDDTVLKSVYRHAMDQEQSNMNKKANIYFEQTFMQHEMQHKTKKAL